MDSHPSQHDEDRNDTEASNHTPQPYAVHQPDETYPIEKAFHAADKVNKQ